MGGETSSWFTFPFEDHVAYLAQRSDQTTVSTSMRVGWETVGAIVQRVVARRRRGDPLDGLTIIGVGELGETRCAKLEAVTIDMSGAYIKAVTEASPEAQIIFDRFHVQRLVQDAVDEVRRDEVRAAASEAERKQLKGTRWPLLKSFWGPVAVRLAPPRPAATREQAALPCLPAQGRHGQDPRLYERAASTH